MTPSARGSADFLGDDEFRETGPAVELIYRYGGTSGRWSVADAIARYFPHRRAFIRDSFAGLAVGPLPSGPYPADLVRRHMGSFVRFTTPAEHEGMGTAGLLDPANEAVDGIVMLVEHFNGPDLLKINVRLPRGNRDLAPIILSEATADVVPQ